MEKGALVESIVYVACDSHKENGRVSVLLLTHRLYYTVTALKQLISPGCDGHTHACAFTYECV